MNFLLVENYDKIFSSAFIEGVHRLHFNMIVTPIY